MDEIDVGAQNAIVPDACTFADFDIADDPAPRRDEGGFVDPGGFAVEADDRNVLHQMIMTTCATAINADV